MSALDPITVLHNGIVALLLPWFPAHLWQIEPVPATLSLDAFQALAGRTPWIGVSWVDYAPQASSMRALDGAQRMRLTVCVRSDGLTERLFGDRLGPGLYPSLATVASVLHGRTVPEAGSLRVTGIAQTVVDGNADGTIATGVVDIACHTAFGDWLGEADDAPEFVTLVSTFEPVTPTPPDPETA